MTPGGPSASFSPWSRTKTVSHSPMTTFISCSTSSTVLPRSRSVLTASSSSLRRVRFTPAAGSASRISSGAGMSTRQAPGAGAGRGIVVRRHHEEVLERRQLGEDADDLEGAANALVKDLVGLEPVDALPLESNLAPVTLLHAGDSVGEGGLARAIGADQAVDAPGLERQRHAVHGRDAAEALHHAVHEEDGLFHQIVRGRLYFCCSTPRMPRGMRRTTATMMAPNRSW